jgi:hypothetical protein
MWALYDSYSCTEFKILRMSLSLYIYIKQKPSSVPHQLIVLSSLPECYQVSDAFTFHPLSCCCCCGFAPSVPPDYRSFPLEFVALTSPTAGTVSDAAAATAIGSGTVPVIIVAVVFMVCVCVCVCVGATGAT